MGSISHTVVSSVSGLLFWQQHAANMLIFSPCSSRHKLNRDEVIHRKTREHLHITVYRCSELNIIYKCCIVTSLRVTWTMRDRSQHCRNNHFLLEWKWAWICNSRHRCLHAFKRTQPCKPGKMMLVSPYKVCHAVWIHLEVMHFFVMCLITEANSPPTSHSGWEAQVTLLYSR